MISRIYRSGNHHLDGDRLTRHELKCPGFLIVGKVDGEKIHGQCSVCKLLLETYKRVVEPKPDDWNKPDWEQKF